MTTTRFAPGFSDDGSKVKMPLIQDKIFPSFVESLPSLKGKCIAITGTTSGTGYWCALAATKKEASVVLLLNRKSQRATVADADVFDSAANSTKVVSVECDLSSFKSCMRAATIILEQTRTFGGLDVLCCNAGIMGLPDDRTIDGFDVQMQVNHLSHALLIDLLMPSLEEAASLRGESRVVFHTSGARFMKSNTKGFGGKHFTKCEPLTLGGNSGQLAMATLTSAQMKRYCHSKLANACYAMALHEHFKVKGSKVKALCADPGAAATSLMANGYPNIRIADQPIYSRIVNCFKEYWQQKSMAMFKDIGQSGADGTCPLMQACFAPESCSGDLFTPNSFKWYMLFYGSGLPRKTIASNRATKDAYFSEASTLSREHQNAAWEATQAAIHAA